MQNKQQQLECTYQDLHEQNNTLSIQMLHQQKTPERPCLEALAMHLFFPGHLFSGLFLLSDLDHYISFLYTLCLTHILSLCCLAVIIFCAHTSCLIVISSLDSLVLIVFVAYTSCLIYALDLYTVYQFCF